MLSTGELDMASGKCKLAGHNGVTLTLVSKGKEKKFSFEIHITENGITIPLSEQSSLKRFYKLEDYGELNLTELRKIIEEAKKHVKVN